MSQRVMVGEVLGAFGVRGWVKIHSHTRPPENILKYSPWFIGTDAGVGEYQLLEGGRHGNTVIARLNGITDRDRAALLRGHAIAVPRDQFPPLRPGEFYWTDLVGLEVRTLTGVALGRIANMMETGANDVMEVHGERERLIPFVIDEFVKEVRLSEGVVVVDWDPDF